MRTIIPGVILTTWLLAGTTFMPAHAQSGGPTATDTPVPTATSTSTPQPLPAAATILKRMTASGRKKNTVHMAMQLQLTVPRTVQLSMTILADISIQPRLIAEAATGSSTNLTTKQSKSTTPVTIDIVGTQAAEHLGAKAWSCGSVQALLGQIIDPLKSISGQVQNSQNLGAETYHGVAVWHIHADIHADEVVTAIGRSLTMPIDLYISKADNTLIHERLTASVKAGTGTLQETVSADLSRYGEPVHVALPADCSIPLVFAVQKVTIDQANAKPNYKLTRPSLRRVPVGRPIQVSAYVLFRTVRTKTKIFEQERVWRNGLRVFFSANNDTVNPKDQGNQEWFSDTFTPRHPGHFRATVTVWSGRERRQKTTWFWVLAPHG